MTKADFIDNVASRSGLSKRDATKAVDELGWAPRVSFESMIGEMVEADLAELSLTRSAR